MSIATWLIALIGPLVVRGLIALSFTAITYTGITLIVNQLVASAQANWSALPAGVLALASMSGIPQGLGTCFGAYMALFALRTAAGFTKYVVKKP